MCVTIHDVASHVVAPIAGSSQASTSASMEPNQASVLPTAFAIDVGSATSNGSATSSLAVVPHGQSSRCRYHAVRCDTFFANA